MELKETFTIDLTVQIAIEDLDRYCEKRHIQAKTKQEKKCALSSFIEDAMEDKDVDLAYFVAL